MIDYRALLAYGDKRARQQVEESMKTIDQLRSKPIFDDAWGRGYSAAIEDSLSTLEAMLAALGGNKVADV